jgi:hypothetical protein
MMLTVAVNDEMTSESSPRDRDAPLLSYGSGHSARSAPCCGPSPRVSAVVIRLLTYEQAIHALRNKPPTQTIPGE